MKINNSALDNTVKSETMENKKLRKERKRGEVTQKCFTFRLDNTNIPILENLRNKGRFINDAIWQYHEHLKDLDLWKYYENLE